MISPARQAAFRILLRIERDEAYADELLNGREVSELSTRDLALTRQIVLGTLRWRRDLDALLETPLKRSVANLDLEVRVALRMGAYQIRHLERVPTRAAVSESVELVKRTPRRGASGLVNAVLRRLPDREPALERSHPAWMIERWRRRWGEEITTGILQANQTVPTTYLRLHPAADRSETIQSLADDGVETAPTEIPTALQLVSGRPQPSRAWRQGRVRVQDLSSQMIVPLLGVQQGMRCLDLCAAPGGKTRQLAELSSGPIAADLHLHRLRRARKLGALAAFINLDASRPLPFRRPFDRILVDAPCSGTGSLARNPDLKWRLSEQRIRELSKLQTKILGQALELLAPGGALVYSTCSIEHEENEGVVERVLAGSSGLRIEQRLQRLPGRDAGEGFFAVRIA